jgi:dTDP-4-dehydrorhamnose 3,5-epimerase
MQFSETALRGAYIVDPERRSDDRGYFARTFCQREFREHGLLPIIAQVNTSFSLTAGTIRGMHFQFPAASEAKLVRCTRGAIMDVIVDLRPESATYLQHVAVELNEDNGRALYVPERFAHGYQVLRDKSEAFYSATEFYSPSDESGIRYDDPRLGIHWPLSVSVVSEKDRVWPLLAERESEIRSRMTVSPPQSALRQ